MERQAQKELMSLANGQQGYEASQSRLSKLGRKWPLWGCPQKYRSVSVNEQSLWPWEPDLVVNSSKHSYQPCYVHSLLLWMDIHAVMLYSIQRRFKQVSFPVCSHHILQVGNVPSLSRWNTAEGRRPYSCGGHWVTRNTNSTRLDACFLKPSSPQNSKWQA